MLSFCLYLFHDVILNFELLRTVGKVASTFECELGCQCLYENGVNLQVSEVCVYATYLVDTKHYSLAGVVLIHV